MSTKEKNLGGWLMWLLLLAGLGDAGCHSMPRSDCTPPAPVPHELQTVSLPPYTIAPPDILLLDTLRVVPLPPYKIEPLDGIVIQATNVAPAEPISGLYGVDADGKVNLGPTYGSVPVVGLTLDEAREAITKQLKDGGFNNTVVRVALGQSRAMQQIRGEHLLRPDGTIGLGTYGNLHVAGLTLDEAKATIEEYLSRFLLKPEVSVDVYAFNSKVYYVITDGGGYGEQVYRFPSTGNETVLDALSQIYGLPLVASKHRIWVSRPDPAEQHCCHTLPVHWEEITRCGDPRTNYQVLPGDRIYVESEPLISLDTRLARIISPIERIFGVTLLGSATVHDIAVPLGTIGNGTGGGGGF